MKVGIIGGTGGMGKGFALRWSQNHEVIVGSRDAARAAESASEYTNLAKEAFGEDVVNHYSHYFKKEQEAFDSYVTDWERRRYFERI